MFKREYFLIVKCWGAVCRSCDGNNKELKGINEGTRKCLDTWNLPAALFFQAPYSEQTRKELHFQKPESQWALK